MAQRTEPRCKRALAGCSVPRAANGVGYGPQIKFGATDPEARVSETERGIGAGHGEIPAAERGYDGSGGRGNDGGGGAGMTEVGARA